MNYPPATNPHTRRKSNRIQKKNVTLGKDFDVELPPVSPLPNLVPAPFFPFGDLNSHQMHSPLLAVPRPILPRPTTLPILHVSNSVKLIKKYVVTVYSSLPGDQTTPNRGENG